VFAQSRTISPDVLVGSDEARSFRLSAQLPDLDDVFGMDPKLAYSPVLDEHLAVWTERVAGQRFVVGQRIKASREPVGEPLLLSGPGLSVSGPAVAYDRKLSRYLVAWLSDAGDAGHQIQTLLVDALSGSPIGRPESLDEVRFARAPAVAYGDGGYAIVWQQTDLQGASEIFSLSLDAATARQTGSPTQLSSTGSDHSDSRFDAVTPAIAFDSRENRFLVAWGANGSDFSSRPERFEVSARSLDLAGNPASDVFSVGAASGTGVDARWPALAWAGKAGEFLAVWTSQSSGPGGGSFSVEGIRIAVGQESVEDELIRVSPVGGHRALHPSIGFVSDTGKYLVSWEAITSAGRRGVSARAIPLNLGPLGDVYELAPQDGTSSPRAGNPTVHTGVSGTVLIAFSEEGSGITLQSLSLGAEKGPAIELPEEALLVEAYPNPFRQSAAVSVAVGQTQHLEVILFDMLGRQVQVIYRGDVQANEVRELTIDGSLLPSGNYLLRAMGEGRQWTVPVLRLR
jgi:hypothetical protein